MTTIYVVTSGSYSDYGIRALFSTKELADAYVGKFNGTVTYDSYKARVEEYELDSETGVESSEVWYGDIVLGTGEVQTSDAGYSELIDPNAPARVFELPMSRYTTVPTLRVITSSREKAIKIAVEKRQVWLIEHGETEKGS